MDPMAQAFAYYNFDDDHQTSWSTPPVRCSRSTSSTRTNFPYGFVTPDDSWSNRWRAGPNSLLGWDPSLPGSGNRRQVARPGAGRAATAFAQCQVTKVFQTVCFRAPTSAADMATVSHDQGELQVRWLQAQAGVPAGRCRLPGQLRERRNEQHCHQRVSALSALTRCRACAGARHSLALALLSACSAAAAPRPPSTSSPRRRRIRPTTTPARRRPTPTCRPSSSTCGRTSRRPTAAAAVTTRAASRRSSRAPMT